MKITRLELENWMGIPQLALDFNHGFNLLYGRNEIGKSSIIQSIRQALLGDAASKKAEYKTFKPWGTDVNAHVTLFFTSHDQKQYRLCKSFPGGGAELFQGNIKLTDEPKKTQEKLFKILDISEKTTNLFHLLFIDQGESLNIFKKKGKENPLDENTKSYIKDIIKETAFKDLQLFEDYLRQELDQYITSSGKKVKSGSEYFLLLQKEETLDAELEDFRQKELQFREKLDQIEEAGKKISGLENEIIEKDKYLETLKKKKTRLDEMEKKQWDFKLVENDYQELIKILRELMEIRERLPVLMTTRQQRIKDLKKQLEQSEIKKKQSIERLEQMKLKKQEREKIEVLFKELEHLKKDYEEVKTLEKQAHETLKELPDLLTLYQTQLEEEQQHILKKIQERSQLETELSNLQQKLKNFPIINREDIDNIRKIEKECETLQTRMDSLREKLKLSFHLTPHTHREIPFTYSKDKEKPLQGIARQPLEITDFQKLDFTYNDHLDIHMTGNLSETDFDKLQTDLHRKKKQLKEKLTAFEVDTTGLLETKFQEYRELKTRQNYLQGQLQTTKENQDPEKQKKSILDKLAMVNQDIQKYIKEYGLEIAHHSDKTTGQQSAGEVRDRLTTAKTRLDSYHQRMEQVLAQRQCTLTDLETRYKQHQADLLTRQENYREMEPKTINDINETLLEKHTAQNNQIEKEISDHQHEIELLESMEISTDIPGLRDESPTLTQCSSQQLRDDLNQAVHRQKDLDKQKKDLLGERSEDEFKMNYYRRKDEIEILKKNIEKIPPLEYNKGDKILEEIQKTEKKIKKITEEKGNLEKQRERLSGETADFSGIIEQKNDKETDYRQTLEALKHEICNLSSLRLLSELIEEEREKAQQEVFRPLQDRVYQWFSTLVGERYQIGIDDDLNLEISGRTIAGDYLPDVDRALSFGTREQLSFLFRLAIAAQLSRKEPAVMVLDDSFVNTDLRRLTLLLDILGKRETEIQFLVFTCRPTDYLPPISHQEKNWHCINLEEIIKPGNPVPGL